MSKKRNLWAQPESEDFGIQIQTQAAEIAATMHSLEGGNNKLRINIAGRQEEFSSFVISVNDLAGSFQIDELIPFEGNNLMQPGLNLSIKMQSKSIKVWFDCQLLENTDSKGIKSYNCRLPEKVGVQQKRQHYRIGLRPTERPSLCVRVEDDWIQRVKLCDLSPKGVGVSLSYIPEALQTGEEVYCRMTMYGQEYPFFATVTHVSEKPRQQDFHIGLKFVEKTLSPEFIRHLGKYSMGLQRQRIRNASRH